MQNALTVTQPISRLAQARTLWKVIKLLARDPPRQGLSLIHI